MIIKKIGIKDNSNIKYIKNIFEVLKNIIIIKSLKINKNFSVLFFSIFLVSKERVLIKIKINHILKKDKFLLILKELIKLKSQ